MQDRDTILDTFYCIQIRIRPNTEAFYRIYSHRQFKDRDQQQLRLQQHQQLQQRISGHHRNNESDVIDQPQNGGGHYQQPRLTASALARMQQLQGAEPTLPSTTTRSLYDVKAMQKEAVLSYVKVIYYCVSFLRSVDLDMMSRNQMYG